MLKSYDYKKLTSEQIKSLITRNVDSSNEIGASVEAIIERVKAEGDKALFSYSEQFDKVTLNKLFIEFDEIEKLASEIDEAEQKALEKAYYNIHKFHLAQINTEDKVETTPGVTCWRETRAIEKVGLYVPGGSAVLPSTFLMLGIPAKIAGCKEIVVCSPPQKNGSINGYIAYCALMLGIKRIYLVGGAQAIAAMAIGTESIPKVDKIFGPGNQYVTKAKTIIQSSTNTAIDMPAGPSEVLIIADESANPAFIAADLLAQAEHGADSQAILVCTTNKIIELTIAELEKQIVLLPRADIAAKAIANSYAVIVETTTEAMQFSNQYAPEHLIIQTKDWEQLVITITNAGSVFLGDYTPESAGDYASGTNHTLPTSGFARSYSGVSVESFLKKITFQHISKAGIKNLGPTVEILAELEGLKAHANAVSVRMKEL